MAKPPERKGPTFRETKDWGLASRTKGIGSGDAPTVLGISPWKSKYKLWLEKTGRIEREPYNEALAYWGKILEPQIARHYMSVTGRKLFDRAPTPDPGKDRFDMRVHPKHDWMIANLDYECLHTSVQTSKKEFEEAPAEGSGVYEGKNTSAWMGKLWAEEVPVIVFTQIQHQMACADLLWATAAVLIGGNTFAWKDIHRDDEFIALMIEQEEEFWEMCRRDNPPEVDDTKATKEALRLLYPHTDGRTIDLSKENTNTAHRWLDIKAELSHANKMVAEIETRKRECENKLQAEIGKATIARLADGSGHYIEWKEIERDSYTVKAAKYRNLYYKKK